MGLLFRDSSTVEQTAVNRSVTGSNPVRGANHDYSVILVLHQMALSSHSLAFSHPELGSEV